jgi:hypothetical protein
MPNKEIKISASIDASAFDKQIESIQQKLNKINTPFEEQKTYQGAQQKAKQQGLEFNKQAESQFRHTTNQTRQELEKFIKSSQDQYQKLNAIIENRRNKLKELNRIELESIENDKNKEKIQRRILDLNKQVHSLQGKRHAVGQGMDVALDRRSDMLDMAQQGGRPQNRPQGWDRLSQAYGHGGVGGFGRAGWRMMKQNPLQAMQMGGNALGAIGTGMTLADPIIRDSLIRRKQAVWQAQGGAAQGASNLAGSVYGNNLQQDMFFNPQRMEALTEAQKQLQGTRTMDKVRLGAGGMGIAAGAATAATGALSSLTGVGAIPGIPTMLGGLSAMGMGAYGMLGNERMRSMAFGDKERYESLMSEEMVSNYRSNEEAIKNKSPLEKMAMDRYMRRNQSDLMFQRQLGFNDNEFNLGDNSFLNQVSDQGFTEQMGMSTAQQMLSASGSTRTGRNVLPALRMQREMDLTNAPQTMGQLGSVMGVKESDQAMVKVLTESVRLGLDSSDFAEEQRNFSQQMTDIVVSSQAGSAEAAQGVISQAGGYFSDLTPFGISQGKSMYELSQQMGSTLQGPRAAIQAAHLETSEYTKDLSSAQKNILMSTKGKFLNKDNKEVKSMALERWEKEGKEGDFDDYLDSFISNNFRTIFSLL